MDGHLNKCKFLETDVLGDCRCAQEEKHYWELAGWSLIGFIIQIAIGIWSKSVSVVADAVHQLFDGGESITSVIVARKARTSFDEKKLRRMGGTISAVLILGASFFILDETLERLRSPENISPWWMFFGGMVGLSIGMLQIVKHRGAHEEHKNVTWWWQDVHLFFDCIGSAGVIVAAAFNAQGYPFGDILASLFIVAMIWIRIALKLYNDAAK